MSSDIDLEILKNWKLLQELILVRIDDGMDGVNDIYNFRVNKNILGILNNENLSNVDKRYEILLIELNNYKALVTNLYGAKHVVKYLNMQDPLSGRTLLDICKYGIFGMKGGVTFFVSGDWKMDGKIHKLLVSNKVVSNLRGGKIKSRNNRKFKNRKSLKKRS